MPAAAVIPAPIAYTNAVAVKKLVVGFGVESVPWAASGVWLLGSCLQPCFSCQIQPWEFHSHSSYKEQMGCGRILHWFWKHFATNTCLCPILGCYCEQNRVFKATIVWLNDKAWNDRGRPQVCLFVGFTRPIGQYRSRFPFSFHSFAFRSGLGSIWSCFLSGLSGAIGVVSTAVLVVKYLDHSKTNDSEGILPGCFHESRTRVWGSKMIRYRRSPEL